MLVLFVSVTLDYIWVCGRGMYVGRYAILYVCVQVCVCACVKTVNIDIITII